MRKIFLAFLAVLVSFSMVVSSFAAVSLDDSILLSDGGISYLSAKDITALNTHFDSGVNFVQSKSDHTLLGTFEFGGNSADLVFGTEAQKVLKSWLTLADSENFVYFLTIGRNPSGVSYDPDGLTFSFVSYPRSAARPTISNISSGAPHYHTGRYTMTMPGWESSYIVQLQVSKDGKIYIVNSSTRFGAPSFDYLISFSDPDYVRSISGYNYDAMHLTSVNDTVAFNFSDKNFPLLATEPDPEPEPEPEPLPPVVNPSLPEVPKGDGKYVVYDTSVWDTFLSTVVDYIKVSTAVGFSGYAYLLGIFVAVIVLRTFLRGR